MNTVNLIKIILYALKYIYIILYAHCKFFFNNSCEIISGIKSYLYNTEG